MSTNDSSASDRFDQMMHDTRQSDQDSEEEEDGVANESIDSFLLEAATTQQRAQLAAQAEYDDQPMVVQPVVEVGGVSAFEPVVTSTPLVGSEGEEQTYEPVIVKVEEEPDENFNLSSTQESSIMRLHCDAILAVLLKYTPNADEERTRRAVMIMRQYERRASENYESIAQNIRTLDAQHVRSLCLSLTTDSCCPSLMSRRHRLALAECAGEVSALRDNVPLMAVLPYMQQISQNVPAMEHLIKSVAHRMPPFTPVPLPHTKVYDAWADRRYCYSVGRANAPPMKLGMNFPGHKNGPQPIEYNTKEKHGLKSTEQPVGLAYHTAWSYLLWHLPLLAADIKRSSPEHVAPFPWLRILVRSLLHHPAGRTMAQFICDEKTLHACLLEEHLRLAELRQGSYAEADTDSVEDEEEQDKADEEANQELVRIQRQRYDECLLAWRYDEGLALPEKSYTMRAYQMQLAAPAYERNGKNSVIIVAETGSGKTIVAIDIIRDVLSASQAWGGNSGRVCMLVPAVALVDQQTASISVHLRRTCSVVGLAGCDMVDAKDKVEKILSHHVCVMTPAIFLYLLLGGNAKQRLYLSDFQMIIFDECHRCTGESPYNKIMQIYQRYYVERGLQRRANVMATQNLDRDVCNGLPQILGLTATPGDGGTTGKGAMTDIGRVRRHIAALMARMCTPRLSCVFGKVEINELRKIVPRPEDNVYKVSLPSHANHSVLSCLADVMSHLVKELEHLALPLCEQHPTCANAPTAVDVMEAMTTKTAPRDECVCSACVLKRISTPQSVGALQQKTKKSHLFQSPHFIHWIKRSNTDVQRLSKVGNDVKHALTLILKELDIYTTARYLLVHISVEECVSYIKEERERGQRHIDRVTRRGDEVGDAQKFVQTICDGQHKRFEKSLYEAGSSTSTCSSQLPLMIKLLAVLDEQFKKDAVSGAHTRVIIFVNTRQLTQRMMRYLHSPNSVDIPAAVRAARPLAIVGANQARGRDEAGTSSMMGTSSSTNVETLAKFREGACKIMIATDVVAEGLDVPTCNLVVLYNMPAASEINQKQKQGRVRAENGRMVVIAYHDWITTEHQRNTDRAKRLDHEICLEVGLETGQWVDEEVDLEEEVRLTSIQLEMKRQTKQLCQEKMEMEALAKKKRLEAVGKADGVTHYLMCSCQSPSVHGAAQMCLGLTSELRLVNQSMYVVMNADIYATTRIRIPSSGALFSNRTFMHGIPLTENIVHCASGRPCGTADKTLGKLVLVDNDLWLPSLSVSSVSVLTRRSMPKAGAKRDDRSSDDGDEGEEEDEDGGGRPSNNAADILREPEAQYFKKYVALQNKLYNTDKFVVEHRFRKTWAILKSAAERARDADPQLYNRLLEEEPAHIMKALTPQQRRHVNVLCNAKAMDELCEERMPNLAHNEECLRKFYLAERGGDVDLARHDANVEVREVLHDLRQYDEGGMASTSGSELDDSRSDA